MIPETAAPTTAAEEEATAQAMAPLGATPPDETTAGDSVDAGDIDPGGTHSANETGQGGDPTDPAKNKAHPWNG